MKAEDLMVGDLCVVNKDVCLKKGTIVKVLGVDSENTLKQKWLVGSVSCIDVTDPYEISCGVWCEYLNPIPLTPEILEKNDFEKQWQDNYEYFNDDENLNITFHPKSSNYTNGAYDYIDIEKGCLTINEMPIVFVHELQQVLRLCKIEKEIIL